MTQQYFAPQLRAFLAQPPSRQALKRGRLDTPALPQAVPDGAPGRWLATAALVAMLIATASGSRAQAADAAAPPTAEAVGLVKRVAGAVQLQRGESQQPLKEGQSLVATDRLVTGADGVAAIVFRDGTQLTVGASTDLHLRRYAFEPKSDDYAFDLYLSKGRAIYASGKIGKLAPQAVRLDTPTATVGVRGTRLILEAE